MSNEIKIDASIDLYMARIGFLDEITIAVSKITAPHVLLKPKFGRHGLSWYFLYGEDLENGISGFGDTPEKAAQEFDHNWRNERLNVQKEKL